MKKLFILILCFALPGLSMAQKDFRPGYIVTLTGDTLKGEVNYKGDLKNAIECTYRVNETAENQKFKPKQLKGYGFKDGIFYEAKNAKIVNRQLNFANQFEEAPVTGNDSVNFMQVLVKGKASLYYLRDATSATHYYFQMDDEPVQELYYLQASIIDNKGERNWYKLKQYVGILRIAFKDCPSITPKIDKTDFKQSPLMQLFYDYNICLNPAMKVTMKAKPKPKTSWGIMAGLSFSDLTITSWDGFYISGGDFDSKPAPTAALFFDFTIPVANDKLSITNAVYYTKRDYKADYYYRNTDLDYSNYRVAYNFDYIRLENCIQYTIPNRKFMPFVQIGVSNSFMLTNKEEISSTNYYLNYPGEERKEKPVLTPIMRKHQLGFPAAIGVKKAIANGKQIFLQANYEFNTGFTRAIGFSSNSHNNAVLVGIRF